MKPDYEIPDLNIENLLNIIVDHGMHLPKYQVERIISPFLEIALPYTLTNYYKNNGYVELRGGVFEMICPEFPLKKEDNNQSTNIDYLMLHTKNEQKTLIFIELKTDAVSINKEQATDYLKLQGNKEKLFESDLNEILIKSNRESKYKYLQDRTQGKIDSYDSIKIIFIFPGFFKNDIKLKDAMKKADETGSPKSLKGWIKEDNETNAHIEIITLQNIADNLHAKHQILKEKLEMLDKQKPYPIKA